MIMRTNIVLDEALVKEAIHLTHACSKREVIHLALKELVRLLKQEQVPRQTFFSKYIDSPIELPGFQPLSRDDIYER